MNKLIKKKKKKSFFRKILHKETMWMQNTFLKKSAQESLLNQFA